MRNGIMTECERHEACNSDSTEGRGPAEEERIDQGSPYANKRNHLHCIVYAIKCLDKKEIETAALTC